MEIVRTIQSAVSSFQYLANLPKEHLKIAAELDGDLGYIMRELEMMATDIARYDYEERQLIPLQELSCDIEDFIYSLRIPGLFISLTGFDSRPGYLARIKSYKESIKSLRDWLPKSSESKQGGGVAAAAKDGLGCSSAGSSSYALEKDLVGFPETKDELLEMFFSADGPPRVISILGCTGLGKTALARTIFDHHAVTASKESHCVAWVVASEFHDAEKLLHMILQKVRSSCEDYCSEEEQSMSTSEALRLFLTEKRYLVFIDDLQPQGVAWEHIKDAFPGNDKGSRVIVTTSSHSMARNLNRGYGSYYVYPMQCLNQANSKILFWRIVKGIKPEPTPAEDGRSERIFIKCDGLPLALISASNYLRGKTTHLSQDHCEDVCKALGNYLASDKGAFSEMKRALVQCYDSLPDHYHKNCLLYVSIFPRCHHINSKTLARKLVAEQLVQDPRECLGRLIDQSMIEPVLVGNRSSVAKRCQVHSTILDFAIQKSVSKNLVTLIHENKPLYNEQGRVRRLTIQSSTKEECDSFLLKEVGCGGLPKQFRLCSVRSLTIFGGELFVLKSCKWLRVLHLEGCSGLNKKVLDDICRLQFLKYLSLCLKDTDINKLPAEMKNLLQLETLEIRDPETPVVTLPVEVIMLPELVYLFGKFELQQLTYQQTEQLKEFFSSNKSKLGTLAGVVINQPHDFEVIITHAKKLSKVKIWSSDVTPPGAIAPNSTSSAALQNSTPDAIALSNTTAAVAPDSTPNANGAASTSTPVSVPPPKSTRRSGYGSYLLCFGGKRDQKHQSKRFTANRMETSSDQSPRKQIEPPTPNYTTLVLPSAFGGIWSSSLNLDSLSIDSNVLCKDFLGFLKPTCTICSSIKLRGRLESLPSHDTLHELQTINKLHLISTGLGSEVLSALQSLKYLEYLKLAEDDEESWQGSFIVQVKGFQSLKELCFEAPKLPQVTIEQGGMRSLASLQLLCPESPLPTGIHGISHLNELSEVILHNSVTAEHMKAWREAAKLYTRTPSVKRQT